MVDVNSRGLGRGSAGCFAASWRLCSRRCPAKEFFDRFFAQPDDGGDNENPSDQRERADDSVAGEEVWERGGEHCLALWVDRRSALWLVRIARRVSRGGRRSRGITPAIWLTDRYGDQRATGPGNLRQQVVFWHVIAPRVWRNPERRSQVGWNSFRERARGRSPTSGPAPSRAHTASGSRRFRTRGENRMIGMKQSPRTDLAAL